MTAWFASDLHLDPSTPDIADRFLRFLSGPVRGADALFLLGDLFEAWIGDDDPEPAHRGAVAAIAAAVAAGTRVFVMRGNRDFMIGPRFCSDARTASRISASPRSTCRRSRSTLITCTCTRSPSR